MGYHAAVSTGLVAFSQQTGFELIAEVTLCFMLYQNAKKDQCLPKLQRIRSAPEGREFRVGAVSSYQCDVIIHI
jgi:hypothetical protein